MGNWRDGWIEQKRKKKREWARGHGQQYGNCRGEGEWEIEKGVGGINDDRKKIK